MGKVKNWMMDIEQQIISELEETSPDLNPEELGFNNEDDMYDWIQAEMRKRAR